MTEKTFALIGAAGYVAPRHLRAIRDTGGHLHAAVDPSDSVGIIDSYFPEARFFTEFEQFDRYMDARRRKGQRSDYVSICSPNYLHNAHVRFALRSDSDAICEKPLVLDPADIDELCDMEKDTGRKVNTILQLRLHRSIVELRDAMRAAPKGVMHNVDLSYITSRGAWYHTSWKGDEAKSGGVGTNIGVHLFDMLGFVFGDLKDYRVHRRTPESAAGYLEFEKARVRWFLSVDSRDLPAGLDPAKRTFRSITVDGKEIEFSDGFTDLHTESYRNILAGRGFGLSDVRPSIETVSAIRTAPLTNDGDVHPYLQNRPEAGEG